MKKIIFSTFLLSITLFAYTNYKCEYKDNNIEVNWKAFKTPIKVGVNGAFNKIEFTSKIKKANDIKDLLLNSNVKIYTYSVNSNNKDRDGKLVNSFFKILNNKKIYAKITDVKDKILIIELNMNGIVKKVPMNYNYKDGKVVAKGVIDLFDFKASKALQSINKACYDLHKGKTWNDIVIGFKLNINCK